MKLDKKLEPFRAAIESLQRLLEKQNNRGVIIGGVAVGFLGKPRFTADVDAMFLLSIQDIPQFLKLASKEDIVPRILNSKYGIEDGDRSEKNKGTSTLVAATRGLRLKSGCYK
jgi:hypothetical protein